MNKSSTKIMMLAVGTIIGAALLLFSIHSAHLRKQEKSKSPEAKVRYDKGDLKMSVFYNRPYKKNREIFGRLVPYGKLWRTGANEATIFANNSDVMINGTKLRSGRHHLITIPYEDHWTIIFNADIPGWGINTETGNVYRKVREDELVFDIPVIKKEDITEQFTISFDEQSTGIALTLKWDNVEVSIPIAEIK